MVHKIFAICIMIAACVWSQKVVDSMDLGDNTMDWRSFVTDEPAIAFAQNAKMLWYATASGAGAYEIKTNKKILITSLGKFSTAGVADIAAEQSGGIWLGSQEGIAYTKDGRKFTNYTKKDGLVSNAITRLHVSSDGTLWVGTKKGISSHKYREWKAYTKAEGVCGENIRDISSSKNGTVYFGTNAGVAVYRGGQWSKYDKTSGMTSNDVKALAYDDRKSTLWVACGETGINTYDGKEWEDFMDVQDEIACIMADTQSRIWVGSSNGIIKYNGFEWVYDQAKMPFPAALCNRMYRDSRGNLWFAIDTGVMLLDNPYPF